MKHVSPNLKKVSCKGNKMVFRNEKPKAKQI